MLDSAQLLTNVVNYNNFDIVGERRIREGNNPVDFHIRLFQEDLGIRYIPASGATLEITFLRADSIAEDPTDQSVTLPMTQPFTEDGSMWLVTLSNQDDLDAIVTGGIRLVLTEGADIKTVFLGDSIIKEPSSNTACP